MKERDVNFFRPMWRRVVVTAICVVWAGVELKGGDQMWILITLGLTAYSVWMFFITFPKPGAPQADLPNPQPADEGKADDHVPPQG